MCGTGAERQRAEKADGHLKRVAHLRTPAEQGGERSLPHPWLCEREGEGFGPWDGSRWRKRG